MIDLETLQAERDQLTAERAEAMQHGRKFDHMKLFSVESAIAGLTPSFL